MIFDLFGKRFFEDAMLATIVRPITDRETNDCTAY